MAAEFALVAADRDRLSELAKAGDRRAGRALELVRRLSFHLSGAQLGITVSSLVLGFLIEPTIARALRPLLNQLPVVPQDSLALSVGVGLAVATGLQMVIGELVPKNLAIAHPVGTAFAISRPLAAYGLVFGPVIRFLNGSANRTVRLLGIEPQEELRSVRSIEELELVIRSSRDEGTLEDDAADLLTRAIRFKHKSAADVLVPRGDVLTVRSTDTLSDVCRLITQTGYSRFPVIAKDIHDVVGLVHAKDIFEVSAELRTSTRVTEVMRAPRLVPESRDLAALLADMREEGIQLAVIVDEHGSTAGIVSLEDLLEEIVGEIDDEYDEPDDSMVAVGGGDSWIVDGTAHRDELAEVTGFEMPAGRYHTLAGFLLTLFGSIPEAGDSTTAGGWVFEIVSMDGRRIMHVRVRKNDAAPDRTGRAT